MDSCGIAALKCLEEDLQWHKFKQSIFEKDSLHLEHCTKLLNEGPQIYLLEDGSFEFGTHETFAVGNHTSLCSYFEELT